MKKKPWLFCFASLFLCCACNQNRSSSLDSSSIELVESSLAESSVYSSAVSSSVESSFVSSKEEVTWSKEIQEEMINYLSYVLPYVEMGEITSHTFSCNQASYAASKPTYTLVGSGDLDSVLNQIKNTYSNNGFAMVDSEDLTYQLSEKYLTVTFLYDAETDGMILKATYDEPFDASSTNEWSSADIDLMNQYLHYHTLPFIYLGTKYPLWKRNGNFFSVYGGKYDDTVLSLAKTAFNDDGYTVSETNEEGEDHFVVDCNKIKAEKQFDDGCSLTILVGKSYIGYPKCYMTVEFNEAFDPSFASSYPEEIQNDLDLYFASHGSEIPYLYLGAINPTGKYLADDFTYQITGNPFDKRVLSLAEDSLSLWNDVTITDSILTASYLFEDGCQMELKLYENDKGNATLSLTYYEKYDFSSLTSWSQEQLADFKNVFSSQDIPFVYLGTVNPVGSYQDNFKLIDSDGYQLKGGRWNDSVLTDNENGLVNQGNQVSHVQLGYASYALKASKDLGDGTSYELYLFKNYDDRIELRIFQEEVYDSESNTSWNQDLLDDFESYCDSHEIPFVYLGRSNPQTYYSSSSGSFVLLGGSYRNSMYQEAETAFTSSEWNITETAVTKRGNYVLGSTVLRASQEFEDGHRISITFGECASGFYHNRPLMVITMREKYDPPSFTAWDEDTVDIINNGDFDSHLLPLVYLNDSYPVSSTDRNGRLVITGGWYEERVLTDAQSVLEEDGWNCSFYTEYQSTFLSGSKALYATKQLPDGCYCSLLLGEDRWDYKVKLIYWVEDFFDVSQVKGTYSSSVLSYLNQNIGEGMVPYLYLNSLKLSWKGDVIQGGNFHTAILEYANQTLVNEGWRSIYSPSNTTKLMAYKEFDDGKSVTLKIASENGTATLQVEASDTTTVDQSAAAWDESTLTSFGKYLHGHELSYFDLGSGYRVSNTDHDLDEYSLSLKGMNYSSYLYENAVSVLSNDGFVGEESESIYGTQWKASKGFVDGCNILVTVGMGDDYSLMVSFTLYTC